MERNNGVTAIIYLAFVRNRTLQPYFRSADTDAIFHSLTTFTFTQTPDAFATPFPARTQRSLGYGCPLLWTSSKKNRKKKKRPYKLVWDSQDIQSSHRHQCKGLRASSESERSHGRFQPQMGRELEPSRWTENLPMALDPANPGRTAVLIRWRAAFYAALSTTLRPTDSPTRTTYYVGCSIRVVPGRWTVEGFRILSSKACQSPTAGNRGWGGGLLETLLIILKYSLYPGPLIHIFMHKKSTSIED